MIQHLRTQLPRAALPALACLVLPALACLAPPALAAADTPYTLPKVRTITAFVRLDRAHYAAQVDQALAVLQQARQAFVERGYQVQTVRIVTQPLGELVSGESDADALAFLGSLDALSAREHFALNLGPAMLHDSDDPRPMHLLARALSTLSHINASAHIAGEDGIHWKVIAESAALVHYVEMHSPGSAGNFNFAAIAMLHPYGPFFPGAWHDGAGRQFSIGFEGANVVREVFARTHGDFAASVSELTRQLTVHAKVAQAIGRQVAAATGWTFAGVDPTPAPSGQASIGIAIETYTGAPFGAAGTMTAALAITTAVKAVPVRQIGYSGLMLPVLEDGVLAKRWADGFINTDDILAYSSVCGTGLDTIPLPGDVTEAQLARIMGDVASLAWKWHKPLTARLQPIRGLTPGEQTHFGSPGLFDTVLHPVP
ncbi:MAG TPA: DUF711 family protein [Steroidobacteraceae bacterium]|nr:DUF711 family protein [Steroidobacteraceae bacterium]